MRGTGDSGDDLHCQATQGVRLGIRIKTDPAAITWAVIPADSPPTATPSPKIGAMARGRQYGATSISRTSRPGSVEVGVQIFALGSPRA